MKTLLFIVVLFLGIGTIKAQEVSIHKDVKEEDGNFTFTNILTWRPNQVTPVVAGTPINADVRYAGLDTVPVTIWFGKKLDSRNRKLTTGALNWDFGYYIRSKNVYIRNNKTPFTNLYSVHFSIYGWERE